MADYSGIWNVDKPRTASESLRHMRNSTDSPKWHWIFQILAAVILGQTLYFKFTGAPESVAIFQKLGAEPWGRWVSGITELIAVILLLIPRLKHWGALIGLGVMGGAIASHIFILGISVNGDGGTLFALAVVVAVSCLILIYSIRPCFLQSFRKS